MNYNIIEQWILNNEFVFIVYWIIELLNVLENKIMVIVFEALSRIGNL